MFSSSYFTPEYFNEHFKITSSVIQLPGGGGGSHVVDYSELRRLKLDKDDQDILEFIVAYMMNR